MQKAYRALAWAFGLLIAFIIYDANTGGNTGTVYLMRWGANADKFAHFMLFGALSFISNLALNLKVVQVRGRSIYLGTLLVSLFVLAEELSQRFIPNRTFDYNDLVADVLGITLFAWLTYVVAKRREVR